MSEREKKMPVSKCTRTREGKRTCGTCSERRTPGFVFDAPPGSTLPPTVIHSSSGYPGDPGWPDFCCRTKECTAPLLSLLIDKSSSGSVRLLFACFWLFNDEKCVEYCYLLRPVLLRGGAGDGAVQFISPQGRGAHIRILHWDDNGGG